MSDHFDGRTFRNLSETYEERTLKHVLRWQLTKTTVPWTTAPSVATTVKPDVRVDGLRVTMVNHATLLVQLDGHNILTDPVWSDRVSPVAWAGPRRKAQVGVAIADLPRIDTILLSHDHYDHCDLASLRLLEAAHRPVVLSGLGMGRLLKDAGLARIVELDWWDETRSGDIVITFAPAQHWSSRSPLSRNTRLWGSFLLRGRKYSAYFAADTGLGPHFTMIRERFGPMDLAMLPIGAYEPRWFMRPQHMNPADAVEAHRILGARKSIGIHWGTFQLTDEARDAPVSALASADVPEFVAAENGAVTEA